MATTSGNFRVGMRASRGEVEGGVGSRVADVEARGCGLFNSAPPPSVSDGEPPPPTTAPTIARACADSDVVETGIGEAPQRSVDKGEDLKTDGGNVI
ncbi:unnamed protein product [Lampetra fluviatilis]